MESNIYMQRCLDLALLGKGNVSPNPMVGCVIVNEQDQIIAEGFHAVFGGPHAEVVAIASVKDPSLLKNCTLYVSLEPCSHFGKTPPCCNLIVQMGIPKVVIAMLDPNPLVAGKGVKALQEAGIKVEIGQLENEAKVLNKTFIHQQINNRPYYILKWARTANNKMGKTFYAADESKQISGGLSQTYSHKWRTEVDAILVGANTIISDQPHLNARHWPGNNPTVIILDPNLKTNASQYKFSSGVKVLVINKQKSEIKGNIECTSISFDDWQNQLNQALISRNIQTVLVEGGAFTLEQFIACNLWDECCVFTSTEPKQWDIDAPNQPGIVKECIDFQTDTLTISLPSTPF
jgi:diaminohydroxyphosphoribosylaminopyrimidine deaminase / 5-amino-6-(5-phosphoribosylamino)uracil reductase